MNVKYTLEEVKKYFKEHNCKLLETQYINNKNIMSYICSCGSDDKITFTSFKQGHRCKKCWYQKIANKRKLDYDLVKKTFEKFDCVLLNKEYINSGTPLNYICSCGNESSIRFDDFKRGQKCKLCANKRISGENHYLWVKNRKLKKNYDYFRKKCYSLSRITKEKLNIKTTKRTQELLGYSYQDLLEYITNHENYSKVIEIIKTNNDKLSIDHIFPIKAFIDYNLIHMDYVKIINSLENLQPMSLKENEQKGDFYVKKDFENWLTSKNIIFSSFTK
jgi:hypothetical protein